MPLTTTLINPNSPHTLEIDRLGRIHLYIVTKGPQVHAVGSNLAELVSASKKDLDWEAIATFFALGFFLNDKTHFKDIRILPPATRYHLDKNYTIKGERYWEWHHTVDPHRTYDETIVEYHRLLQQAVERCTQNGHILLPISGGLDSRSLAAVMPRHTSVQSYSYGYTADSIEISIASQIAHSKNLPFTAHVIQRYLFDRLPEVVTALHGSQDVTQARQVSISKWLAEHGDIVLTGLWGDVWCDQMGLADGLPENTSLAQYACKKFRKRGSNWLLKHVVGPQLGVKDWDGWLTDRIDEGLRRFSHIEDIDFRLKAYKTSQWAFRWSNASLRAFELGATPRIPYYDNDLVDFFCTVPTEFVRDRRLQIDHLKRYAPELARIKWQQADANLYWARYGYWLGLPRRAYQKVKRSVRGERAIQRNWELQFLSPEGRNGLEHWLLRPGLKIHEFVSPLRIKELIEDLFASPRADNGYTVSILLTFSAWLEVAC